MPMGFFSAFRKPRPNYFLGFGQADSTARAEESLRTVGGSQSIYEASDRVAPLQSEIVAYPEVDPAVANAVTRVQYVPETMFVTRTPDALVAQPITYEQMRQEVSPFNWQAGREPTVRLAYSPPPVQLRQYLPNETTPMAIPNMQRIARDGGMILPMTAERFSAPSGSYMDNRDMTMARWQAYMAARRAQKENGFICVPTPGVNDLMTPVTTNRTIPKSRSQSPFGPSYEGMDTAIRAECQKGTATMMSPDLFPGAQDFVPTQEIGPSAGKLPTWAWVAIAAGLYFIFKGKKA